MRLCIFFLCVGLSFPDGTLGQDLALGSFEDLPIGTEVGGASSFEGVGDWTVGGSGSIQGTENGVTPLDGSAMLRFDGTEGGVTTDIYQLIELTPSYSAVGVSAHFNSVASERFFLALVFTEEDSLPIELTQFSFDAQISEEINTDSDPLTWERTEFLTEIPQGSRYVALRLHSDTTELTTYADSVSLTLVPEPSTGFLALSLLGILVIRRREIAISRHNC